MKFPKEVMMIIIIIIIIIMTSLGNFVAAATSALALLPDVQRLCRFSVLMRRGYLGRGSLPERLFLKKRKH
jgi:hypothetical protein